MSNLELNGRTFRDLDSYNAAKRDFANIERLKKSIDMTSVNDVRKLRDTLYEGSFRFETILGDDFIDELDELEKKLESNTLNKTSVDNKKNKRQNDLPKTKSNYKKSYRKNSKISFDDDDEELKKEIIKNLKRNELKRKIALAFLSLVAFGCIAYLCFYYFLFAKNDVEYKELASLVDDKASQTEYSVNIVQEDKTKPKILKKYETLYQKNHSIVGWLKIVDTKIDYPVMQTINNEYYLEHNYNQEYDKNGSIFLDKDCDAAFPNDNMIVYGHHMKSGKMFGNLNLYSKESYCKEHPYILFDTIYEEGKYQVMYVFR